MKKAISELVVAAFIFSLVASAGWQTAALAQDNNQPGQDAPVPTLYQVPTSTDLLIAPAPMMRPDGLERIPSPNNLKYFQVMKREGNALFGRRLATSTPDQNQNIPVATSSAPKLEKISHPGMIGLFERIQKIGTALWGMRKKIMPDSLVISSDQAACVVTAIDTKDKALIVRVSAAATELNAAISARSACQQDAIKATTTPRSLLNACVKTFNDASKTVKDISNQVHKDVWTTYQTSLKACRTNATSTQPVPVIEDGGSPFGN